MEIERRGTKLQFGDNVLEETSGRRLCRNDWTIQEENSKVVLGPELLACHPLWTRTELDKEMCHPLRTRRHGGGR